MDGRHHLRCAVGVERARHDAGGHRRGLVHERAAGRRQELPRRRAPGPARPDHPAGLHRLVRQPVPGAHRHPPRRTRRGPPDLLQHPPGADQDPGAAGRPPRRGGPGAGRHDLLRHRRRPRAAAPRTRRLGHPRREGRAGADARAGLPVGQPHLRDGHAPDHRPPVRVVRIPARGADQKMTSTVRSVTYDLLRSLGLTTVFGNPGSTEETFLQEFPDDFSYVLGLQEASVIAMADAFAQVTRRPALVNLHSSAGVGNALGNLVAAYHGNTPLIVTAGQQHRELMIGEPYLGNREATAMPKPWVKWSYEPYRAQDVPEAFMRAYAMAVQPPAGPVFLSIPLDDWNQPLPGPARVRTVSDRVAPDAERLRLFADRISASRRPALVFGPDVDRSGGWDAAIALAEKLRAAVYGAPLLDRASFPEDHPLFRGPLGMSVKTISGRLAGHDLAVVIGAEVFRYYPYVPGDYLPAGTEL